MKAERSLGRSRRAATAGLALSSVFAVCGWTFQGGERPAQTRRSPAEVDARARIQQQAVLEAQERSQLIVGWNAFSLQFIDPPRFELLPMPAAASYVARVRQGESALEVVSKTPLIDLGGIWSKVKTDAFDLTLEWRNRQGGLIASNTSSRKRAPGWQGRKENPADWAASADRNIAFLIEAAEKHPTTYREPGVPVWVWNAISPGESGKPMARAVGYPSLHMPLMIGCMVEHARARRPRAAEAARLAEVCGDWLLSHRRPDAGALPLFPFSTISEGTFAGGIEGDSVNLLRASHMALGLVKLYEFTGKEKYLDYACHIADTTVRFQQPDGSFPYRVDPGTGEVKERYTCHASEFVALVDALARHRFDPTRERAARRARDWLLAYPLQTGHWQAGYEDVAEHLPYLNLENWAGLYLIQHLCRRKKENPSYLPAAERLHRWIEDQFVAFGNNGLVDAEAHFPTPMMREQYRCWFPMEVHTGNWILALIELHRATGNAMYLEKAMAAGNAIAKSQFDDGEYSTWGKDQTKPSRSRANWYGCNARGAEAMYILAEYTRSQ